VRDDSRKPPARRPVGLPTRNAMAGDEDHRRQNGRGRERQAPVDEEDRDEDAYEWSGRFFTRFWSLPFKSALKFSMSFVRREMIQPVFCSE